MYTEKNTSLRNELKALALMAACSFLAATSYMIFKQYISEDQFLVGFTFEYVGSVLLGLILFMMPVARSDLKAIFKNSAGRQLVINGTNEVVALVAMGAQRFVSLSIPIFLISTLTRLQVIFVFVFESIWLSIFADKESLAKLRQDGLRKLVGAAVALCGVVMIVS